MDVAEARNARIFSHCLARGAASLSSSSSQVHCLGIPQAGMLLQRPATQVKHVPPFVADCGLDANTAMRATCTRSRDADSSGRKPSGIGSRLAQCKDCSEAVELHSRRWDTKRCPNKMCTKLNDIGLTWPCEGSVSAALPMTPSIRSEHCGDYPESYPKLLTRLPLPIKPLFA